MRILLFLIFSWLCLGWSMTAGATSYAPGSYLLMTWSTTGTAITGPVRFDVAPFLVGYESLIPRLDIDTGRVFTGAFYTEKLWWIALKNGSETIHLDCGAQSLGNLTNPCQLTGTGYWENIWVVSFGGTLGRVEYLPISGTLSGSAYSPAVWVIPLNGIFLPLRPASFESLSTLRANANGTLSISWAARYSISTEGWELSLTRNGVGVFHDITIDGVFDDSLDLSIATTYQYTITDPSQSVTSGQIRVFPAPMSQTIAIWDYALRDWCSNNPTSPLCPDGATVQSTRLLGGLGTRTKTTAIADDRDPLELIIALRDRYGNSLQTSGDTSLGLSIQIDDAPDQCQTRGENDTICDPIPDTALHVRDASNMILPLPHLGTLPASSGSLLRMTAQAPSSVWFSLDSLRYTYTANSTILDSSVNIPLTSIEQSPRFLPLYTLEWVTIDTMDIGEKATITGTIIREISPATPTSLHLTQGIALTPGVSESVTPLDTTTPAWICGGNPGSGVNCSDWTSMNGWWDPWIRYDTTTPGTISTQWEWSGSIIGNPLFSTATLTPVFSYTLDGDRISYYGSPTPLSTSSLPPVEKVKIIGSTIGTRLDGEISTNSTITMIEMRNQLRKNIDRLSDRKSRYENSDILIIRDGSDLVLTGSFAGEKKTVMIVGGDIIIRADIGKQLAPRAIVALSDPTTGQWGNIIIESGVKLIAASILSDRSLISGTKTGIGISHYTNLSDKQNQLYLFGTLMTQNTMKWDRCPLLVSTCTTLNQSLYSLDSFRSGYTPSLLSTTPSPTAQTYSGSSLVIEYDPRIISTTPKGVGKEK